MEKSKIIGIYRIVCIPTNDIYVGHSIDILSRWRSHKYALRGKRHTSKPLQYLWGLYKEAFRFDIVERVKPPECNESWIQLREELLEREVYWAQVLNANLTPIRINPKTQKNEVTSMGGNLIRLNRLDELNPRYVELYLAYKKSQTA